MTADLPPAYHSGVPAECRQIKPPFRCVVRPGLVANCSLSGNTEINRASKIAASSIRIVYCHNWLECDTGYQLTFHSKDNTFLCAKP